MLFRVIEPAAEQAVPDGRPVAYPRFGTIILLADTVMPSLQLQEVSWDGALEKCPCLLELTLPKFCSLRPPAF